MTKQETIKNLKGKLKNINNMSRKELGIFLNDNYDEYMDAEGMYFNLKGFEGSFFNTFNQLHDISILEKR